VDSEKPHHLRTLARGTDYFAEVGRGPRLAAAVLLAPFAASFLFAALILPIPAVHFAAKGQWPMTYLMLGLGAGHGLVGFGLGWLVRRLWRGTPSGNRRTVLPTWLVGAFLVGFLTPLGVGMAGVMGVQAVQAVAAGDIGLAGIWAAGAVGSVVGLARAYRTFFGRDEG
jgi:hypothetical protein